jgi:hypothetical protein
MNRQECINIVNRLKEFNILTETQAQNIVEKRDKMKKDLKIQDQKLEMKRKIRHCCWCNRIIKRSGMFFCTKECSKNRNKMDWNIKKQTFVRKSGA